MWIKKFITILTVNIIIFAILILAGELLLRVKDFQPYVRTYPGQYQNNFNSVPWAQSDSLFGWTSNTNNPVINKQGFHDKKDFDTICLDSGKVCIMILGDSFMWGAGVKSEKIVANLLQTRLKQKYEIFNISVPGWGIDQMHLAYQHYKHRLNPDIVILAYIDNDVNRVLESYRTAERMNKPTFTIKKRQLVIRTSASRKELLFNSIMKKSIIFSKIMQQIYIIKDARSIVSLIFRNVAQETQNRKKTFVVIRIPTKDFNKSFININQYIYSFKDTFQNTNAIYLEPLEEIKKNPYWLVEYYLDDGHLSETGHEFLTDYIYKYVFKNKIL